MLDAVRTSPFMQSFMRYPIYNQPYSTFTEMLKTIAAGGIIPVTALGLSLASAILSAAVAAFSALSLIFSPFIAFGNGCGRLVKNTTHSVNTNGHFFSPVPERKTSAWEHLKQFFSGFATGFSMTVLTSILGIAVAAIGCICSAGLFGIAIIAAPSFLAELGARSTLSAIHYFFPEATNSDEISEPIQTSAVTPLH